MERKKLIERILKGESLTNSKELFDWVNQSKENENTFIKYKNLWALLQEGKEMDTKSIEEGLNNVKHVNKQSSNKFFRRFIKYAAIVVLSVLSGYIINTLDFGKKIAMNEIEVPKGNRMSVILPDRTKVWLNNGSRLIYPQSFEGKTRQVKLIGEGYFEVKHDKSRPFIVNIGENRIRVLGTNFSISAYPDDKIVKADLISGKILFDISIGNNNYKSYKLKPSQSITFNKNTRELSYSKIIGTFYDYWHNGIYVFNNESFGSLAKKIERIYNIKIIFEKESLKDRQFTGTFEIDDNIYTLIEVFKRASSQSFEYKRVRNKIFIK